MTNFFYISGIVFWAIITLIGSIFYGVPVIVKLYRKYIGSTLSNIKTYFFGSKWFRENNCAEIYFSMYSGRPNVIAHWHKSGCARHLAYYRFLKEARKDMPEYLKKHCNNKQYDMHSIFAAALLVVGLIIHDEIKYNKKRK